MALSCLTERALETLIPVIGHRMKFMRMLEEKKASTKADSAVEIFDKVTDSQDLAISDRGEFSQHALKRWMRGTIEALRMLLSGRF